MDLDVGDLVQVRIAPDVDPHLWEEQGLVAELRQAGRLVLDLQDGADVTVNREHVDPVDPVDVAAAFRGTAVRTP